MMMLLARVLDAHPESHAVDVEMLQTGQRFAAVQVLSPSAGGDFGLSGLVKPKEGDQWREKILAAVAFLDGVPVVVGFLYPQVSQMLFEDKERAIVRHQSDVHVTIDGKGNTDIVHPSGAFLSISEGGKPANLDGKDYDRVWAKRKNTDRPVYIAAEIPNKCKVVLSPDGNVEIWALREVLIHAGEHIALRAPRIDLN